MTFRDLLADLNPLQHIPVVGSLYRAITGDTIPQPARLLGSLVVGGLTGGPIGAAANLGFFAIEQATGIDPEAMTQHVLARLGIGHAHSTALAAAAARPSTIAMLAETPPDRPAGWTQAQLAAYGVTTGAHADLRQGALHGSDVLNGLELARHGANFAGAAGQAASKS